MSGSSPTYNYPAQPSYGEGMREALEAQVALLSGGKVGEADFRGVGKLEDLVRKYEEPLRKTTAQIDTDVLRQTILGDERQYDDQGRRIIGYDPGERGKVDPEADKNWKGELEFWEGEVERLEKDSMTGGFTEKALAPQLAAAREGYNLHLDNKPQPEGGVEPTPIYSEADPSKIGKTYSSGGMIGLLGDTRAVQEQARSGDYAQYVKDNPDLEADFVSRRQAGEDITIEEYGQQHYDQYGKAEGRDLAMGEYTLQDAGRQAGFDESGQFRGLSALAEDIGRGGQQRAREADIADVERLGGRATEAYRAQGNLGEALGTARAMGAGGADQLSAIPASPLFTGTAVGSLADRARAENLGISAITGGRMGDYDPLALPPAPGRVLDHLTHTAPTAPTATAIQQQPQPALPPPRSTSAAQVARRADGLSEEQILDSVFGGAQQGPVQPGQQAQYAQPGGTDAFRSALMQQGYGALDQGITARENRAIQEAARARATNMGRTFDQTASIREAEAVIAEDNARRMQNRAFAQSALGQEVGIQQADLARELQAQQLEMARQTGGVDRQLTAEEKDIERAMRRGAMEEQFRQSGLGAERASAAQMVGLEQATSADPFQAILQRQGQNNLGAGGALFGQAGYGLESGPQYLNPEAGLGFISNQATNAANMFNAQQAADATRSAGMFGGLGSLAGGIFGGAGAAAGGGGTLFSGFCWVAREVYGPHNPAWLDFRQWMFSSAPRWFFKLYLTFGERFANFISNKPRLKARIRMWMDSKIGR